MQYSTIQYSTSTVYYSTVQYQYHTVQYQYSIIQYNTIQYQYHTVQSQYSIVQYSTVPEQYSRVPVRYNTVHYSTVQYSTVEYSISTLNNFTLALSDDFLHVTQTRNFPLGGPHFPVIRTNPPAILSGWPRNYCSVTYIRISVFSQVTKIQNVRNQMTASIPWI
jgi:hypothetical protein